MSIETLAYYGYHLGPKTSWTDQLEWKSVSDLWWDPWFEHVYVCQRCDRARPWSDGGADDLPDICDDCWAACHDSWWRLLIWRAMSIQTRLQMWKLFR